MEGMLSKKHVADFSKKVREGKKRSLDGDLLGSAIDVACDCALKPSELRNANVGDYTPRAEGQPAKLKVRGARTRELYLPPYAEQTVKRHIETLKRKGYPSTPDSPFLPRDKSGTRHSQKSLERKINRLRDYYLNFTMEDIRQAGIRRYYEWAGNDSRLTEKQRLQKTAEYAGVSEKHVEDVLKDDLQVAGDYNNNQGAWDKFNPSTLREFRKALRHGTDRMRQKALDNFEKIEDFYIENQRGYKEVLGEFVQDCQEAKGFTQEHLDILKEYLDEYGIELSDDVFWKDYTGEKVIPRKKKK